jgi:hypothetical protein
MILVSIHELYDLVKSLSKSEKRFFKLTASSENHDPVVSKLFDELEQLDAFDEAKIQKILKPKLKQVHEKELVKEVYDVILKSQRTFFAESIPVHLIKDEISNLRNLFDKAQYKQCRKMLNKLKEEAYGQENFNFILEIISVEKQLIDIESKFGMNTISVDDLINEEQNLIYKAKNLGEYAQTFSHLNYLIRQNQVVKNMKEFEPYDKLLNASLLKNQDKCLSRKSQVIYHHCRALCYSKKRDNITRQKEFKEMVLLMDKHPFLISEFPKRYLSAVNNILSVEIESANYATAEKLIDNFIKLKKHPAFNTTDLQLKIFTSTSNAQLLIYTDGGKSEKVLPIIKYINEQIELFKGKINKEELLIFYYNFANLYIYSGDFEEAGKYVNIILNENDKLLRQDLQCFSRIQNIIVHYELKKYPQLSYILKTARDFYKDQRFLFKTEKLILELFEELPTSKDPLAVWKKAYKELSELLQDPYEKTANYYFDFLAYMESKTTDKKVGDIIYKKQIQSWKR